MATTKFHTAVLRPVVIQILRATGFQAARGPAVEILVDLAWRYLVLISTKTAENAWTNHNGPVPDIIDVRMGLQEVGALKPEKSAAEEQLFYDDDMRGIEAFLVWMTGPVNAEIRRMAGLVAERDAVDLELDTPRVNFLAELKRKHNKTGEDSRYQGTALGKDLDEQEVMIEGDEIDSIQAWNEKMRRITAIQMPIEKIVNGSHLDGMMSSSDDELSDISTPLSQDEA